MTASIFRIDYTIADGNVWDDSPESADFDRESSLNHLAEMIDDALHAEYPDAAVNVERVNASGAVCYVRAWQTSVEYGDEPADDGLLEQIAAVADDVWVGGGWYVAK
jgi:hypothetical protein